MTDNAKNYTISTAFQAALADLDIRHKRTQRVRGAHNSASLASATDRERTEQGLNRS
jgi:hypothetical protein